MNNLLNEFKILLHFKFSDWIMWAVFPPLERVLLANKTTNKYDIFGSCNYSCCAAVGPDPDLMRWKTIRRGWRGEKDESWEIQVVWTTAIAKVKCQSHSSWISLCLDNVLISESSPHYYLIQLCAEVISDGPDWIGIGINKINKPFMSLEWHRARSSADPRFWLSVRDLAHFHSGNTDAWHHVTACDGAEACSSRITNQASLPDDTGWKNEQIFARFGLNVKHQWP